MKSSNSKSSKLAIAAIVGAVSFPSHAALISSWDWFTSTGFVPTNSQLGLGTATPGGATAGFFGLSLTAPSNNVLASGITNAVTNSTVAEELSWGTGATDAGQSSLVITNLESGVDGVAALQTNAAFTNINLFTHNNNPLNGGSAGSPWSTLLQGGFSITGATGTMLSGFTQLNDGQLAPIALEETQNTAPCGGLNLVGTTCDDIFTTPQLSGEILLYSDTDNNTAYFVQFQFDAQSANVDSNGLLVDIYTGEGQSTTVATQARVFSREIPAPATVLLFGLGLSAFAGFRRKMQKTAK